VYIFGLQFFFCIKNIEKKKEKNEINKFVSKSANKDFKPSKRLIWECLNDIFHSIAIWEHICCEFGFAFNFRKHVIIKGFFLYT
jgi:hypothetical protein